MSRDLAEVRLRTCVITRIVVVAILGVVLAACSSTATPTTTPVSAPVMDSATVMAAVATPINTSPESNPVVGGTAPTYATGEGEVIVSYSEAVTCSAAAGSDFSYSNSNSTSGTVAGTGDKCTQAKGGDYNGAKADNHVDTLVIALSPYSILTIGGLSYYEANSVAVPINSDTLTYTAPGVPTTTKAVYAGSASRHVYAATGTLTDNGTPTVTTRTGTATRPSNPLI